MGNYKVDNYGINMLSYGNDVFFLYREVRTYTLAPPTCATSLRTGNRSKGVPAP